MKPHRCEILFGRTVALWVKRKALPPQNSDFLIGKQGDFSDESNLYFCISAFCPVLITSRLTALNFSRRKLHIEARRRAVELNEIFLKYQKGSPHVTFL